MFQETENWLFCSGGDVFQGEGRLCPFCGAPLHQTSSYSLNWNERTKQYEVKLIFDSATMRRDEVFLRRLTGNIAAKSSCSCGRSLVIGDHAIRRESDQIIFEAVFKCPVCQGWDEMRPEKIRILFLAAEPTDASRLRLGEELREIQEKLQLSALRDRFVLYPRMSVRSSDMSQALLDVRPHIVHFSGHGTEKGELCLENRSGEIQPFPPSSLRLLFDVLTGWIHCVILNACYSEIQAEAIAKYIDYVVGMPQAIGDQAAIAFTVGFYQALGAGKSFPEAYKLGCAQLAFWGTSELITPILLGKAATPK